ncbi:MAG: hypothetical protein CVU24_13405 [Betaproteobacteria bacterium HGW-Betaproteobacteria-18]|nr:MAG: hypothetical protein CVU24_13405 [Betaproteobacteria bacterium HGW-Betaproteobacteria-18]
MNKDNLLATSASFPIVGIGASAGGLTALEVLRTLVFREADVSATGRRWFKVRIMPYRTHDNRIDGLVMTFADISSSKQLEAELREAQSRLQALVSEPNAREAGHGIS